MGSGLASHAPWGPAPVAIVAPSSDVTGDTKLHAGVRQRTLTRPCYAQLFDEVNQSLAARRVTQLAQRLGLNLANAFTSHTESLAHLLQRPLVTVDEPEAELQHASFARRQRVEDVLEFGAQHRQ